MRTFTIRFLFHRLLIIAVGVSIFFVGLAQAPVTAENPPRQASKKAGVKGTAQGRVALYASVGEELIHYSVDIEAAKLVRQGSVILPASVQEGWIHPARHYLYVAWSNRGTSDAATAGEKHGVTAFRIDPTGALHPHGEPLRLISRPIYITGDITGTHILVAYNDPSGVTVHTIAPDGTFSSEVNPLAPLDVGVYAHQVRVSPSNKSVILVTRGNRPVGGKPEDPGALKIFSYKNGVLGNRASVAPGGGFGFQPRHLDFHPSKPWVFVSLEAQNKLYVYKILGDGTLGQSPLFIKDTVADSRHIRRTQTASTIHVHPNGRFVYVGNRASGTLDFQGKPVFLGGENNIAVFRIDQDTGEPALIQSADTHGILPRTFSIDPSGRLLVAANQLSLLVRDEKNIRTVPPGLTVYRIGDDGRLEFVYKNDIDTGGKPLFWVTLVPLT
jgi:6-phosphogluconolactonase